MQFGGRATMSIASAPNGTVVTLDLPFERHEPRATRPPNMIARLRRRRRAAGGAAPDPAARGDRAREDRRQHDGSAEALDVPARQPSMSSFSTCRCPGLTGFELLEQLDRDVPVVFTTAYDQYALEAFAVNSIDYLLKPIEPARLDRALDKLERFAGQPRPDVRELARAAGARAFARPEARADCLPRRRADDRARGRAHHALLRQGQADVRRRRTAVNTSSTTPSPSSRRSWTPGGSCASIGRRS